VEEDDPPIMQEFKVWFQKGSCNKFIMCIKTCLQLLRDYNFDSEKYLIAKFNSKKFHENMNNDFKDDPSKLIEQQPPFVRENGSLTRFSIGSLNRSRDATPSERSMTVAPLRSRL
jgi:hypothetical protein